MFVTLSFVLIIASIECISGAPPLFDDGKIIGGYPVNITQIPWHVALVYNRQQACGGSIISNRWILTAGHCMYGVPNPKRYKVLVGTADKERGGKKYSIASYIVHKSYNFRTIDYDFALIELDTELSFNERIQPVQLPKVDDEDIPSNSKVLVSGWGKINSSHSVGTRYLRAVELLTVDQQSCKNTYSHINRVTERMFCAGFKEGGKNACHGDSGGPVVSFSEEKVPTQVGIVSWGISDCAAPGYPGVYARILTVRKWIHEKSGI